MRPDRDVWTTALGDPKWRGPAPVSWWAGFMGWHTPLAWKLALR